MPAQPPPSPPFFVGAGPAGAAYPEIRRQANLSAWPCPFRLPPSFSLCPPRLPLPALFRWRREAAPRIQRFAARRISPLGRTRSASRHPSLYARPAFRSPPLSLAARSVAAYPKDSPSGESPRFGWGGLSRRGPAPSLTPRLPSHAPPFPQPQRALGGGCWEGSSPPDFPSCPAALPAGTGRFPHFYRNPQSRPVRTPRPSRFSNLGTAEIASFQAPDVCEAKPSARPRPTGPGPSARGRRQPSARRRKAGPSRKRTHVRFRDSAPARLTGSPSRMP